MALEEKLTLLQETLESLPEALSRFLTIQQLLQQQPANESSSNSNEQQRRQQFLHPETSYGVTGQVISHSKSAPNTWTAPILASTQSAPAPAASAPTTTTTATAASTNPTQSGCSSVPPTQQQSSSKPSKLS